MNQWTDGSDAPRDAAEVVRVLLIDDDEDQYYLTRAWLAQQAHPAFHLDWVPTYDAGLDAIRAARHDVCLIDDRLGDRAGLDLIRDAAALGCRAPIILLTVTSDLDGDGEAMRLGAADYLTKDHLDAAVLSRAIRYALQRARFLAAEQAARALAEATSAREGAARVEAEAALARERMVRVDAEALAARAQAACAEADAIVAQGQAARIEAEAALARERTARVDAEALVARAQAACAEADAIVARERAARAEAEAAQDRARRLCEEAQAAERRLRDLVAEQGRKMDAIGGVTSALARDVDSFRAALRELVEGASAQDPPPDAL